MHDGPVAPPCNEYLGGSTALIRSSTTCIRIREFRLLQLNLESEFRDRLIKQLGMCL